MIRAIHVEDEPGNVKLVQTIVNEHCSEIVTLEGNAGTVRAALELIKSKKPQLLYMDIELNRGNSFELIKHLEPDMQVIFITAFNEYAVKAFRCNAVDYLLKPISIPEFVEATKKAEEKIKGNNSSNSGLAEALKELQGLAIKKIGIPISDGVLFMDLHKIVRIEAKGSYTCFYINGAANILCTKSLKEMESMLPVNAFLRIHHSWMINVQYLKKYYKGKNSYMEMEDGSTVPVSVRKKSRFFDFFN
jgi:two-component system LytT family response regulator